MFPARLLRSSSRLIPLTAPARLSTPFSSVSSRFTPRTITFKPQQQLTSTPRTYSTMSDHGNVIPIKTEAEFNEKVKNSTGLVVVDCYATWCGPCRAIAPRVAQLSLEHTAAKFYQIDVDELSNVAADLGIRAMPTFILFKNGERLAGADVVGANANALENAVKTNIA
ncbi:hypothetical protein SI65_06683 [Aspergillus cristatus]|uniref:Thioredoxin domain-containing protein n=1 Tax=Aspergillus cristatus TaxID=573508 RepID=A0A1E3BAB0_ASPCR|nr:hypothetical protein SI65_06683 [Aspergillus cristatus]